MRRRSAGVLVSVNEGRQGSAWSGDQRNLAPMSRTNIPAAGTQLRPTAVDLFAGAGGFSLGAEQAGADVLAAVEYDPICAAVHRFNFSRTEVVCADAATLTVRQATGRDQAGMAIARATRRVGREARPRDRRTSLSGLLGHRSARIRRPAQPLGVGVRADCGRAPTAIFRDGERARSCLSSSRDTLIGGQAARPSYRAVRVERI